MGPALPKRSTNSRIRKIRGTWCTKRTNLVVRGAYSGREGGIIGKIARPRHIHIVPDMPKTRSGKLMRRILASISNRMNTGDITTLTNPDVVEQVRELVQGGGPVAVADGPDDVKQFGKEE